MCCIHAVREKMMPNGCTSPRKPAIPVCENMQQIAEDMNAMRSVHCSTRRTTNEYLMFCLIGFASIERRDALLNVVSWALEPLLLYSAFVKDVATQEFEAVVVTKKQVGMNTVEEWLGLFNMGVCCIEFEQYMQAAMVTCISRIHHMGKHWHGSFKTKVAARVRRDFYKEYTKQQQAKETQRVLDVTGLAVTPRNMLTLHSRIGSLQDYVSHLERQRLVMSRELVESRRQTPSDTQSARDTLAEAYRRLQASGDLPLGVRLRSPPDSPSRSPTSPVWSAPNLSNLRVSAFQARPPPTGNVTLYVLRS
jgi:hypothetical protein